MKNFKTYGEFLTEAYSDEERKKLADKGFALSDGSFPIKDLKDLKNAIQAYGRAKDQARAAKFIVKRAKALGAEDLIPDTEDFQKSLGESVVNEGLSKEQKMVETFLNKVAKEFDYSIQDAVRFVKETITKMRLDESVVTEAKMTKEKIEGMIWSLENENDSWHPSSDSKKKAMLDKLKKDLSKFESVAVGSHIHDVSTELPAKAIALPLEDDEEENGSITEGTDIGSWNQGGLKGKENVLITTFVGPKDVEDFGLGRKCMQINVGMKYVSLNPADIVELKDILKSYKVK